MILYSTLFRLPVEEVNILATPGHPRIGLRTRMGTAPTTRSPRLSEIVALPAALRSIGLPLLAAQWAGLTSELP